MGAEYHRLTGRDLLRATTRKCTMKNDEVIEWAAIPPKRYGTYKWPTLEQLHRKLFQTGLPGAHDALVDVEATMRRYFKLREMGVL